MKPLHIPLFWLSFFLICEGRLLVDPTDISDSYDFVIVGAGTAGNVLANRLSDNSDNRILVIEAGISNSEIQSIIVPLLGLQASPNKPWTWNYTTIPQLGLNNRTIQYPRGRVLGGSSSINFMVYTRGSSDDFDRFARVTGDNRWSWNALQPYIKKHEHFMQSADHHNSTSQFDPAFHNFNGPLLVSLPGNPADLDGRVIQTTQELEEFPFNFDMNSGDTLGIGWTQSTIGNSARCSSAIGYLNPIMNRTNVDVLIETRVIKLLHAPIRHNAVPHFSAVEFAQSSQGPRYEVKANKEIILSAGSINTPQLLMLSGIGDSAELSKSGIPTVVDLPSVGKNLTDHPLFASQWIVNNNSHTMEDAEQNATIAAEQLTQWITNGTGPLVVGPSNQLGWLRLPSNSSIFKTVPDSSAGPKSGHFELLFTHGFSSFVQAPPVTGRYMTILASVASPLSRGTITLQSKDPFVSPLIDPRLLTTDYDMYVMKEAVKSSRRFVTASAWRDYVIAPYGIQGQLTSDADLESYIRNVSSTLFHPAGTASMSPRGASWGAVNPDLTVKGVKGLRIVDASVFPYLPAAHPQAAVYIMAEYAADLIKSSH